MDKDTNNFDTIILGSGISGLNLARKLAQAGQKVFICSKEAITEGSSNYAQGGVAVVSPLNPEDSVESHIQDTISSGKGLCNEEAVTAILTAGWTRVEEIRKLGVNFDKNFNLEGSHSYKRVMHVGDATGRAIVKPLLDKVSRNHNVFISQGTEAFSLIKNKNSGRVCGISLFDITGEVFDIFANNIVLATGGIAALYEDFTCPNILTGDGIALAYDAGAKIENLEFVQFHPTVFKSVKGENFLISEALRGAGAQLRNAKKELFANKYHPDAELATRDIVSRAIYSEMKITDSEFVYIDATKLNKEMLQTEFPNIYKYCLAQGYDLACDLLPVRPAAHYSVGGIKTDINGKTNLKGLYALGECAANGLHGANRLASNSLLECIVVPEFVANSILEDEVLSKDELLDFSSVEYCSEYSPVISFEEKVKHKELLAEIRNLMSETLSVERKQKPIQATIKALETIEGEHKEKTTALLLAKSALARKESRGAHFRADIPRTLSALQRSTILSKEPKTYKVKAIPHHV